MKVGFTGTRKGMTSVQISYVRSRLSAVDATELHHGDCVGADAQAHALAREMDLKVVSHPPTKEAARAFCKADEERKPLEYKKRNEAIVNETEILIAAPEQTEKEGEVMRSGTWMTIRIALRKGKTVFICWPEGGCTKRTKR